MVSMYLRSLITDLARHFFLISRSKIETQKVASHILLIHIQLCPPSFWPEALEQIQGYNPKWHHAAEFFDNISAVNTSYMNVRRANSTTT